MDKKMTLEHVASDFRAYAADGGASLSQGDLLLIADAIDAELKARGEPKAWLVSQCGPTVCSEVFSTRAEADECADAWDYPSVEPLFAAPPAPKIEVTVDFVRRVLEHYPKHHANGLFIPLGEAHLFCALEAALKETP